MIPTTLSTWTRRLCLCIALVGVAGQMAHAEVLDDLGSPDFRVRELATHRLLIDSARDLDSLRELYAAADSLEQRHRLLDVIRHHLVRQMREEAFEPRGGPAVGFSHEIVAAKANPTAAGESIGGMVRVVATLPGFPGHAYFEPGDLVIEIDDQPLPANLTVELFQGLLRRYEAGQMLAFTILRGGDRVRVQLRLASGNALARIYGNDPQLKSPYLDAWQAIRAELDKLAGPMPVLQARP